jgi:hypothetical protein
VIVHRAFCGLTLALLFAALGRGDPPDLTVCVYLVVLLAIRTKFWIDDEAYFEDASSGRVAAGLPFYFGLGFAFLSWILWCFAAFFLKSLEISALLMVFVFAVSTAWIIAAMVKAGAYKEQVLWLFFNVFYGFGFYALFGRNNAWNPFRGNTAGYTIAVCLVLFVVFLFDLISTRIIELKRRHTAAIRS